MPNVLQYFGFFGNNCLLLGSNFYIMIDLKLGFVHIIFNVSINDL